MLELLHLKIINQKAVASPYHTIYNPVILV